MTPAEVLAAHQPGLLGCIGCDWHMKSTDPAPFRTQHAAHVLDALTKAGHVVVTLPEPVGFVGGFPDLPDFDTADDGSVCVTEEDEGRRVVWHENAEIRHPRRVAAALLAAAAAAETGGKA